MEDTMCQNESTRSKILMNAKCGSALLLLSGCTLCCTYRNILNMAQENDSVFVCMLFIFVRTSASRSLFVDVCRAFYTSLCTSGHSFTLIAKCDCRNV
jgi:hypothetical protein